MLKQVQHDIKYMISPIEEQQFKTDLLQSRLNKPNPSKANEAEIAEKAAATGAKMAAASMGAVDPLSQKAAEIAGKFAGEKIYKNRKLIFWIIAFFIIFLLAILILSILSIWGYYCNNLAARVMMMAAGVILKCP